ncbi:hypothetical protein EYV94_07445 [Puteibacter caeruleilacunae]|nr:hypothetical protein EYV94_07445 [Puteibacter caeruleilacunae]
MKIGLLIIKKTNNSKYMKMKVKVVFIVCCALFLSGCFSAKVLVEGKAELIDSPRVVLLGAEINPYQKPKRVNTPEMWFNRKINKRSEEIQKIAKSRVDVQYEILTNHLKNILNVEIVADEEVNRLLEQANCEALKHDVIESGEKRFPHIFCSDSGIHPIEYKAKKISKLNENLGEFKERLAQIAKATSADAMILSISAPHAWGVGAGGFVAKMDLRTYIYVFAPDGSLRSYGEGSSKPFNTNGKDIADFMDALDEYKEISGNLITALK